MLETGHEDNPILFTREKKLTERGAEYLAKLDRLSGVRYDRLRLGKWSAVEGVIYEDFDPEVHIISAIPTGNEPLDHAGVPLSWRRYWSVDFGYVNPFVLHCWAEDGDGRLYLYREIYHTHQTVDVHAKNILGIVRPEDRWLEPKPTNIVCDHDAEGRAVLERELEMSTQPAHKSVLEGIEAVQVRLRDPGDGRRRIYLVRGALVREDPELADSGRPVNTIEEVPGYIWATNGKDAPVKADDHGCDAMRYVVADRDFGIRAIYRSFEA
jgi:phage terminase large subunit